jgi:hypothetical protein
MTTVPVSNDGGRSRILFGWRGRGDVDPCAENRTVQAADMSRLPPPPHIIHHLSSYRMFVALQMVTKLCQMPISTLPRGPTMRESHICLPTRHRVGRFFPLSRSSERVHQRIAHDALLMMIQSKRSLLALPSLALDHLEHQYLAAIARGTAHMKIVREIVINSE